MSLFQVTKETIATVSVHPNADLLELVTIQGKLFTFVVRKGVFKVGDHVIHFPVDSLMPSEVLKLLNLEGKLSGKDRNRVKTLELRGIDSQGLLMDFNTLTSSAYGPLVNATLSTGNNDLTELFGVTKYVAPEIISHAGRLVALPAGVSRYDIESAQNFPEVLERLLDIKVQVTEKLEGTNYSITALAEGEILVNQRGNTILPIEGHVHQFHATTRAHELDTKVKQLQLKYYPNQQVTIRGELIGPGVQKNIYKLKQSGIYVFDLQVGKHYVNIETAWELFKEFGITTAPVLASNITLREWLGDKNIITASTGPSVLNPDHLREGIVIKPLVEESIVTEKAGKIRLFLKQRDPIYLKKTDF